MDSLAIDKPWIRRFHDSPESEIRLVCFPHAGGAATYYFPYSEALSPDIEVLAVQYPGRQDRRAEPLIDDLGALADLSFAGLADWTDKPFAFFGHSMGALIAYEVAQRFERRPGPVPVHLFVSGRRAPSCHRDEQFIHTLNDRELVAEMRRVGGTDPRFLDDPEIRATILPVIRNDYRAVETYRWSRQPPLRAAVTAMTGDDDPQNTYEEAAAWREHCSGGFELETMSGGHFFLDQHRDSIIRMVGTKLRDRTEAATRRRLFDAL
jgi:pyochelin biosynthetic protein PchC